MKIYKYILHILLILPLTLYAQKQDHFWIIGYEGGAFPDSIALIEKEWGNTNFDFNYDPVRIEYDVTNHNWLFETNSIICDSNGILQAYSNGARMWNKEHKYIEDTINYGNYWESRKNIGMKTAGSMTMLPRPNKADEILAFYSRYEYTPNGDAEAALYSIFKDDSSENKYFTFAKDVNIFNGTLSDTLECSIAACRHANGRDWWVLYLSSKSFYLTLLTPDTLLTMQKQTLNYPFFKHGIGQVAFSPDGSKLVMNSWNGYFGENNCRVNILDFDRCTGEISNPRLDFMYGYGFSYGLSFSPDSRFAYASNDTTVVQFDLTQNDIIASKKLVATDDGFGYISPKDVNVPPYSNRTLLGFMTMGPDGRTYITAGSASNKYFGSIEYPEEEGLDCEVRQHSVRISAWYGRTAPNLPNYRLGPLDGSFCDTLGLDNNPIAKYRYEGDTLDHLKVRFTDLSYFRPETWHWDFGDGTTFDDKKPYWHTFPKNGVYKVCLTVSNENSENTTCRLVTIGTNSIDNNPSKLKKEIVSVFPNPTQGELLLTLSDYIPEHGVVEVYDMLGKLHHKSRVYYGWNNLDLKNVPSGTYHYVIKDGNHVISSGSIVKI